MNRVLKNIGLPLLLKELVEQASRRRTYIIRVVYVTLFFVACLAIILPEISQTGGRPLNMLGVGRNMFAYIVGWQFAGIYLFLPALACSVITNEKETNTLGLLFLTRLGPWTIVIEKLLSRLFPMYCLLLCSLPLLAFTISFGGVDTSDLLAAVWFLSVTTFQIGAIAVACSSFFRTTVGALLACYLSIFLIAFGLPLSDWLIFDNGIRDWFQRMFESNPTVGAAFAPSVTFEAQMAAQLALLALFGFIQFIVQAERRLPGGSDLWFTLLRGVPLIVSGLIPIVIARFFLIRRAFVPSKNLVLAFLRRIDQLFSRLNNNRFTQGIVILDESRSEPDFSPIAWRETHKRSLGQTRYLVRVLLALQIPVLLVIVGVIFRLSVAFSAGDVTISVMTMLVWLVSALLVTVTSAALISGERGRQTLDILLVLPMSGRQIILDKVAGARRLMWVCAVPLVTSICFEAWWRNTLGERSYMGEIQYQWWAYQLTALSLVATYLPMLSWLSIWIGLKTKSPTRATLTALITVVAWCAVPLIVLFVFWEAAMRPSGVPDIERAGFGMLMQLSPIGLLVVSEFGSLGAISPSESPLVPMVVNALFYGGLTFLIRRRILLHADRLLGRTKPMEPSIVTQPLTSPPVVVSRPSLVE